MQHVVDDDYVGRRSVGQGGSVGVSTTVPALEHGVVNDVDKGEAEVAARPHGALAAPWNQRGDVVVADVALCAIPSL